MKSEKIIRAIGGIDDDIIESAENNYMPKVKVKTRVMRTAAVAALGLVLAGAALVPAIIGRNSPAAVNDGSEESASKPVAESGPAISAEPDNANNPPINVIWADGNEVITADGDAVFYPGTTENDSVSALKRYGKFKFVGMRLVEALKNCEKDEVLAIRAYITTVDDDYIYEGRPLSEYRSASDYESRLPELLAQLLKLGDELKYGTALYETGTPDGLKYTRELYEWCVELFGKDLLEKYIVNGEFLKNKAEEDLEKAIECVDARELYYKALGAYLDQLGKTVKGSLPAESAPERNSIIMFLTKDQFSALDLYNAEEWDYELAIKDDADECYEDA